MSTKPTLWSRLIDIILSDDTVSDSTQENARPSDAPVTSAAKPNSDFQSLVDFFETICPVRAFRSAYGVTDLKTSHSRALYSLSLRNIGSISVLEPTIAEVYKAIAEYFQVPFYGDLCAGLTMNNSQPFNRGTVEVLKKAIDVMLKSRLFVYQIDPQVIYKKEMFFHTTDHHIGVVKGVPWDFKYGKGIRYFDTHLGDDQSEMFFKVREAIAETLLQTQGIPEEEFFSVQDWINHLNQNHSWFTEWTAQCTESEECVKTIGLAITATCAEFNKALSGRIMFNRDTIRVITHGYLSKNDMSSKRTKDLG